MHILANWWMRMVELTRLENHVLALILKWQPTTAYFIRKSLADTIASNISDSPGSVYPAIARLKRHGLVAAEPVNRGKRPSENLTCTLEGEEAVRRWLTLVDPTDMMPEDPLRTRIRFADLLTADELRNWLGEMRAALREIGEGLDRAELTTASAPRALEIEHAKLVSAARLAWINSAMAMMSIAEGRSRQPFDA